MKITKIKSVKTLDKNVVLAVLEIMSDTKIDRGVAE